MMDLDNNSVCKECMIVCTHVHYEDWDGDIIMYREEGVSTKNYNEAMFRELTKTVSEEEQDVNCNVALCAKDSVSLEKR